MSIKNNWPFAAPAFAAVVFLSSCTWFDPPSPTASYIHIDSITVTSDYPTQGSKSSRITDAWIFYDNEYLGTFPLPADIPLIGDGAHKVSVRAGIIENGIASSRVTYPKYSAFESNLNLVAKETTPLTPVINYETGTTFPQIEDFDDASLTLVPTSTASAAIELTTLGDPNAYEGNSGRVTLFDTITFVEVASSTPLFLPLNVETYLELNFKCDVDFSIGVFVTTTSGIVKNTLIFVRATTTWRKIYVNLSGTGGILSNGLDYKIYLRAEKGSLSQAQLFFDNLKVVY